MERKDQTMNIRMRKTFKSGKSLVVALPPEFIKQHNLKAGDNLFLVGDEIVKIIPMRKAYFTLRDVSINEAENIVKEH